MKKVNSFVLYVNIPALKIQLFRISEFIYCSKKEERAIPGRYIDNGCPGIILSELSVPGKWQGAISISKDKCNLHVEYCNQEQMTLDSTN